MRSKQFIVFFYFKTLNFIPRLISLWSDSVFCILPPMKMKMWEQLNINSRSKFLSCPVKSNGTSNSSSDQKEVCKDVPSIHLLGHIHRYLARIPGLCPSNTLGFNQNIFWQLDSFLPKFGNNFWHYLEIYQNSYNLTSFLPKFSNNYRAKYKARFINAALVLISGFLMSSQDDLLHWIAQVNIMQCFPIIHTFICPFHDF